MDAIRSLPLLLIFLFGAATQAAAQGDARQVLELATEARDEAIAVGAERTAPDALRRSNDEIFRASRACLHRNYLYVDCILASRRAHAEALVALALAQQRQAEVALVDAERSVMELTDRLALQGG